MQQNTTRLGQFSDLLTVRVGGCVFQACFTNARPLAGCGGNIRDLSGVVADISGDVLTCEGSARLQVLDISSWPMVPGYPRLDSV